MDFLKNNKINLFLKNSKNNHFLRIGQKDNRFWLCQKITVWSKPFSKYSMKFQPLTWGTRSNCYFREQRLSGNSGYQWIAVTDFLNRLFDLFKGWSINRFVIHSASFINPWLRIMGWNIFLFLEIYFIINTLTSLIFLMRELTHALREK